MADVSKITLPSGEEYNIKDATARGKLIYPVIGTQTESTNLWTGNIDAPALYDGMTIAYFLPYTGNSSNATLNLTLSDGTTTGAVNVYHNGTTRMTSHEAAGSTIIFTYWSAGSISVAGTATTDNRWTRGDYDSNSYNMHSATGASTAAKAVKATYYYDPKQGDCFPMTFRYANTKAAALTMNVNDTGAYPLYINGTVSSSTNYTIPRGLVWAYFDGTNWHINSDGTVPRAYYTYIGIPASAISSGTIDSARLPIATTAALGGVIPDGTTITVDNDGTIHSSGGGGGGASVTTVQVTIAVADWSSKTATKTVTGVTASNVIVIAGDPSCRDVYNAAGIYAYSQTTNSVTFKCDTTPTDSVLVNVMIFDQFALADYTEY